MITEFDIDSAIAECQGEKNPNAQTCIKLAAFLTIKQEMFGKNEPAPTYSNDVMPINNGAEIVEYESDTEFSQVIYGRDNNEMWGRIDEFMTALKLLNRRLYNSVLSKLSES